MEYLTVAEVAAEIKRGITKGELLIGAALTPDYVVAGQFETDRDTLQLSLQQLQEEGYLDERNRVHRDWRDRTKAKGAYGSTLAQNLLEVFEEADDVRICVYSFTSETFNGAMGPIWEKIQNREIAIGSLSVRLLVSDTTAPLVIPAMVKDPNDPFALERLRLITDKHTRELVDGFNALRENENVGEISIELRMLPQTPPLKVLILNDRYLQGLYIPEKVTIQREEMFDLRGWRMPLNVSRNVEEVAAMMDWFDGWWGVATPAAI
jgi:DNA-binding transcriptional regulator YhcF (GntR family)